MGMTNTDKRIEEIINDKIRSIQRQMFNQEHEAIMNMDKVCLRGITPEETDKIKLSCINRK
jgi:hypothetical protein